MPFNIPLSVTIPAGTVEKDAVRSVAARLPARCVVDRLVLHVPSGHQAKVPVWLEVDGAQVLPDPQEGDGEIRLDNVTALELTTAPLAFPRTATLKLAGYNEDVDPHTTRLLVVGRYRTEIPVTEALRLGL